MNIPDNDTYLRSVAQLPAGQQTEQNMLLNAIRNKFANNANAPVSSAPNFSIPNLKLPQFSSENLQPENGKTQSKLNQFILGQLSESKTKNGGGKFMIPNLQAATKSNDITVTLVDKLSLKSAESDENIDTLKNGIKNLQVRDEKNNPMIDLTMALNRHRIHAPSPSKQATLTQPNPVDFKIPFIDCDLRETAPKVPPRDDDYCQMDVSGFVSSHYIASPSKFGKITCLRYRLPKRLHSVRHRFSPKHDIVRFDFRTKSPDDIVQSSLRKYNKV